MGSFKAHSTLLLFLSGIAVRVTCLPATGPEYGHQENALDEVDVELLPDSVDRYNHRPIVGILSQELSKSLTEAYGHLNYSSYIGAAYVKYIESGGARVVPILINQDDEYYEAMFNKTSGLLIPGGSASIYSSGYSRAGKKMFNLAKEAAERGDNYPIWGTCLGFELLVLLAADDQPNLKSCASQDQPLPLDFTETFKDSRMAEDMPEDIEEILTTENVTINFHKWCLTPRNFSKFEMDKFWDMLATGEDTEGLEFVAMVEAKDYQFWGSQFHPEKNIYEWTPKYPGIPHYRDAIRSSNYMAEFFVEQCRKNAHEFDNRREEEEYLIYNYNPTYTGDIEVNYVMQQCYFFE